MVITTGNFELEVDPADRVYFFGPFTQPSTRQMTLTNNTRYQVAFKVKCTDNNVIKIDPPVGLLKIGEAATVNLTAECKPSQVQNIYIMNVPADETKTEAREAWQECPQETGKIQMDVAFGDEE